MTYWYSLTLGHLSTLIRETLPCRTWQPRQRPTINQCSEEETKVYLILKKISISQPWPQDSGIIKRELIKNKHCLLYTIWKPQNKVITILINFVCKSYINSVQKIQACAIGVGHRILLLSVPNNIINWKLLGDEVSVFMKGMTGFDHSPGTVP